MIAGPKALSGGVGNNHNRSSRGRKMRVLVGDIGGTKTGLAVAETIGGKVQLDHERRYPSRDYASLDALLRRYCDDTGAHCDLAALAIAGPVRDGCSKTTNLPWEIDAGEIRQGLGFSAVRLLNDLEAVAWGVAALGADEVAVIHPGDPDAVGNGCVVAAGTGLGEAGMYWDGQRYHPFATEGGHTDFAPADEREFALYRFLQRTYGHVSWERVASGTGIGNLHAFLLEWRRGEVPDWLRDEMAGGDLSAAIARAGTEARCPICAEAMDLFAILYGREAGNVALKHLALGGVYLGGGVAPKNLELLRTGGFAAAFLNKGRMRPLMERMPVRVILEQRTPLFGAARFMAKA
jgi:glucokinase